MNLNTNKQIPNAPCYACLDRTVGCHSECEKYKVWREREVEKKDNIREQKRKIKESYAHDANMLMRKKGKNWRQR